MSTICAGATKEAEKDVTICDDPMAHAVVLDFKATPTAPTHVHEEVDACSKLRKRKRST